jgi:ribosomal protein S12 methylthiotransferase accessory factor
MTDSAALQAIATTTQLLARPLPRRPRLPHWVSLVDLGDGRVQLRASEPLLTLRDPTLTAVVRQIAPALDGRQNIEAVLQAGGPEFRPAIVHLILQLLQARGLLQDAAEARLESGERARWDSQLRFLEHFVANAETAHATLRSAHVAVVGSGPVKSAVIDALRAVGVQTLTDLGPTPALDGSAHQGVDLLLACHHGPADLPLQLVNRAALNRGLRWMRVGIAGTVGFMGPTVLPRQTACWACVQERRRANDSAASGLPESIDEQTNHLDEGCLAPMLTALAGQAALEATRILAGFAAPMTIGRYYEMPASAPEFRPHTVLRVPRCAACGPSSWA